MFLSWLWPRLQKQREDQRDREGMLLPSIGAGGKMIPELELSGKLKKQRRREGKIELVWECNWRRSRENGEIKELYKFETKFENSILTLV